MSCELKGDVQDLEVRVWVQTGIHATIDTVYIAPESCGGGPVTASGLGW